MNILSKVSACFKNLLYLNDNVDRIFDYKLKKQQADIFHDQLQLLIKSTHIFNDSAEKRYSILSKEKFCDIMV